MDDNIWTPTPGFPFHPSQVKWNPYFSLLARIANNLNIDILLCRHGESHFITECGLWWGKVLSCHFLLHQWVRTRYPTEQLPDEGVHVSTINAHNSWYGAGIIENRGRDPGLWCTKERWGVFSSAKRTATRPATRATTRTPRTPKNAYLS